jgi:hypothetical protein
MGIAELYKYSTYLLKDWYNRPVRKINYDPYDRSTRITYTVRGGIPSR